MRDHKSKQQGCKMTQYPSTDSGKFWRLAAAGIADPGRGAGAAASVNRLAQVASLSLSATSEFQRYSKRETTVANCGPGHPVPIACTRFTTTPEPFVARESNRDGPSCSSSSYLRSARPVHRTALSRRCSITLFAGLRFSRTPHELLGAGHIAVIFFHNLSALV
jgi:hypothetical protein